MSGKITDVFRQRKSSFEPTQRSGKKGSVTGSREQQEELPGVSGADAVTDSAVSEEERLLRQFDLDTRFGPCTGLTRMERWSRAEKFGLNPPQHIRALLDRLEGDQWNKNLWDGRV